MGQARLSFHHVYLPGDGDGRTLMLFHGTGGDERDLLDLGRALAPGAALLGVRGKVQEGASHRFFRRLAPGVFDPAELTERAGEMVAFAAEAGRAYGIDGGRLVAVGYSNGANMAAAMLLLSGDVFGGAVLFRAMVPLSPERPASLSSTPVLVLSGRRDPIVPAGDGERLASALSAIGASATHRFVDAGHELTEQDVREAKAWLHGHFGPGGEGR